MSAAAQARYSPAEIAERLGSFPPTQEQAEVIAADLSPRLVIAGAGSGKTATMADRVVWLVANGLVLPDQVLGVTFTRKAAGELGHRINARLRALLDSGLEIPGLEVDPEQLGHAEVSTYHSYAGGLVRDHGLRIGVEPGATLIGDADAYRFMHQIASELPIDRLQATGGLPSLSTLVSGALSLSSDMAEHLRTAEEVVAYLDGVIAHGQSLPPAGRRTEPTKDVHELLVSLRTRRVMAELVEQYAAAKAEAEVMDFGDLLRHAATIAAEVPLVGRLERDRWRVVLLDEFQDTSHAQMQIFSGLFGAAGEGAGHSVTAVGDPHQSIYGFRGASAGQLFTFPHAFPVVDRSEDTAAQRSPASVSHLTVAWRNDRAILDLANAVVAPLAQPDDAPVRVRPLRPRPEAGTGHVRLDEHLTDHEEAADVVARLAALADDAREAGAEPPTRAVLCRTRSQFDPILAALDEAGVPYEVLGLTGLLTLPEVAEVLGVLHLLADPTRSDRLLTLLAGPRWRIGTADLALLAERARFLARLRARAAGEPAEEPVSDEEEADAAVLLEAVDDLPGERSTWRGQHGARFSEEGLARLRRLRELLRRLARRADDDLPDLIAEIERSLGLDVELAIRPGTSAVSARRHLNAFVDVARDFAARGPAGPGRLRAFLDWVESAEEHEKGLPIEGAEPDPHAITVLTAHAAKGLEWDVVAVPGLLQATFPSTSRITSWMDKGSGALPWPLRGDARALPQWDPSWAEDQRDWFGSSKRLTAASRAKVGEVPDHRDLLFEHVLADERRLAYVAYTRARRELWLSTTRWKGTVTRPAPASDFFTDAAQLVGRVPGIEWGRRLDESEQTETNPALGRVRAALWPFDPLDGPEVYEVDPDDPDATDAWRPLPRRSRPRRAAVEAAARAVRAAEPDALDPDSTLGRQLDWVVRREKSLQGASDHVALPSHVSVSLYGELASDPQKVADQLRRPMPRQPAHAARRGTAFHAWLEDRFDASGMLDIDDPQDAADAWMDDALDLESMKQWFLASRWADRTPAFVEAAVETTVAGLTLRGRVDAIYRDGARPGHPYDPQARWELVDWKTGAVPTGAELELKGLQLAVYRLAWSRLHAIPIENIDASFVYVAHGVERRMTDLADEETLERILADALGRTGD